MRKIFLFMNVTLDGYFEGPGHDISWAHGGSEPFSPEQSQDVDTILLGRKTYELMKNFWPTPQAEETQPEVARFMNDRLKVVASRKPFEPGWTNVTVISDDVVGQVKQLKAQPAKTIIMLGSNNLCVSLMQAGLVDEFQLVVNPVALGAGTSLFTGLSKKVGLTLTQTRQFQSGAILFTWQPAAS